MTQPPLVASRARRRSPRSVCLALVTVAATTTGALAIPTRVTYADQVASPSDSPTHASEALIGLRVGARGSEVERLQEALIAQGIQLRGGADGIFGPATADALSRFQGRNGLEATGTLDQATAVALGLVRAPAADVGGLARGATGAAVRTLQEALLAGGVFLPGGVDGVFGSGTERALRDFQRFNRLTVTGTVTPATQTWLDIVLDRAAPQATSGAAGSGSTSSDTRPGSQWIGLAYGSGGTTVRSLQQRLMDIGIAVRGGADGVYGTVTVAAIEQFQRANGVDVTGRVDTATAAALAGPSPSSGSSSESDSSLGGDRGGSSNGYVGLKIGARGERVREVQQALLGHGFVLRGGADGVFGAATTRVLKIFQRINKLPETGEVGTREAQLLKLGSGSATPSIGGTQGFAIFGERGPRVLALQNALIAAGISFTGGADGAFGGATAAAVMELQRRQGLRVTGRVDATTASRLGLSPAAKPPSNPPKVVLEYFPVQGHCGFVDTWHAPRAGGRLHLGVDIIAEEGKLLYAVTDGEITRQYWDTPDELPGNGLNLTQPNGTYFTYLHMLGFAPGIEVGAKVKAGDVLGWVGNTGSSATAHLHFEIQPGGGPEVNPYPYVKAIDACHITEPRY